MDFEVPIVFFTYYTNYQQENLRKTDIIFYFNTDSGTLHKSLLFNIAISSKTETAAQE